MKLNPNMIPSELHQLIPLVEIWGIADDYEREEKVQKAIDADILLLVSKGDDIAEDEIFNNWLFRTESGSFSPLRARAME